MRAYDVHGLTLTCDCELPELAARRRDPPASDDVLVRMTGRPDRDDGTEVRTITGWPVLNADAGAAVLTVPGVGRYVVSQGREILVEPEPGSDPRSVRLFLLGSALGLLCHQRGLLPLHASAVARGGRAIAFMGQPGQGKSTLAAHCLAFDAIELVADDILVVATDGPDVLAQPGMPQLKLWRDALAAVGRTPDGLRADWLRSDKFHMPVADRCADGPMPLRAIYILDDDEGAGVARIAPLRGAAATAALIVHTYRVEYLEDTVQRAAHFAAAARLAARVPVRRLARARALGQVRDTAAAVLADLESVRAA